MTTRIVTGVILKPDGAAFINEAVCAFTLLSEVYSGGVLYPQENIPVFTDALGAFSVALAVPATGAAPWRVTFIDGFTLDFNLPDGAPVILQQLITVPATAGMPSALDVLLSYLIDVHLASTDPHGDRAFSTSAMSDHVVSADPHADRAYTDTIIASLPVTAEVVAARNGLASLDAYLDSLVLGAPTSGAEVVDARGSAATLDTRLDASLNNDGTLITGIVAGAKLASLILPSPNLAIDAFNRNYRPTLYPQDGTVRWYNPNSMSYISPDASNPYGCPTIRMAANAGKRLLLNELGLKIGDTVSFGALAKVPTGSTVRVRCLSRDVALTSLGYGASSYQTGDNGVHFMSGSNYILPATAWCVDIYIEYSTGSGNVDVYQWVLAKGSYLMDTQTGNALAPARSRQAAGFIFPDEYCRDFNLPGTGLQDGRARWFAPNYITKVAPDLAHPFCTSLPSLSITATAGRNFWLDEAGVVAGDVLSFGAYVTYTSGEYWHLALSWRNAGDAEISQVAGSNIAGAGTNPTFLAVLNQAVPAGAVSVYVWIFRSTGTNVIKVYGWWAVRGETISDEACRQHAYRQRYGAEGALRKVVDLLPAEYGRQNLVSWHGAQAWLHLAEAKTAKVLCLGDSITNTPKRYVKPLAALLKANLGGDAGIGYLSFYALSLQAFGNPGNENNMPKYTSGGANNYAEWDQYDLTTTPKGVGLDLTHIKSSVVGATCTYVMTFTDVAIHYLKQAGGGSFKYKIDTGSWSSDVDTANATDLWAHVDIPTQASASHTLVIQVVTGPITLIGLEVYDLGVASGIAVMKCGQGGGKTGNFTLQTNQPVFQASLANVAPDLVIIALGANDRATTFPAAFKANLLQMMTDIRGVLATVDFLLVSPYKDNNTYTYADAESYARVVMELAREYPCAAVDLSRYITYARGNPLGWFDDITHTSRYGGAVAGDALYQVLKW